MDIPGTDYWPVAAPTGHAGAERNHYRAFSQAVLAQHQRVRAGTRDTCTCGSRWEDCKVATLAQQLLADAD